MIEALDTAVVELDENDRICQMNGAAEQCLGTGRDRARGAGFSDIGLVPDDLRHAVADCRSDQRRRHVLECRLAGGLYDCNIQPFGNRHVLLELYDLRWEHQRQQLAQREIQTGMLDLLRRNLGHEIRNPLGGIRGAAQMMAEELGDQELGTLARLIMREVDRIDELIRRFGHQQVQRAAVDIHRACDEAIDLLNAETAGACRVVRDYDPSIPEFNADEQALRQVLLNLVMNAHQANAGEIVIRTRIEHGASLIQAGQGMSIRVDVSDDGDGVPEHLKPMLFLPLVTGRRDGTGLGLAISQQIAAAHGGLITYEALQQGSCFSLRLPLRGGMETLS